MATETVRIDMKGFGKTPTRQQLGLDGFDVDAQCETHTYVGGIQPGPSDLSFTVEVALVAAGSGVLVAAIRGVFAYLASLNGGKIVIRGSDGTTVEVPEGISEKELDLYIQKAKKIGGREIEVNNGRGSTPDIVPFEPQPPEDYFP